MLYADIFVLEFLCDLLRSHQNLRKSSGRIHIVCGSGNLRELFKLFLHIGNHSGRIHIQVLQKLWNQTVLLHQKRHMKMFSVEHLMPFGNRYVLAVHNRLLCILCIFFNVHIITPIPSNINIFFHFRLFGHLYYALTTFYIPIVHPFKRKVKKNLALFLVEC